LTYTVFKVAGYYSGFLVSKIIPVVHGTKLLTAICMCWVLVWLYLLFFLTDTGMNRCWMKLAD